VPVRRWYNLTAAVRRLGEIRALIFRGEKMTHRRPSLLLVCVVRLCFTADPTSGVEFTTKAFVGRIDAAVSLSQEPRLVPDGLKSSWEQARVLPKDGMRHLAASAWKELKAIEERVLRRAKARWDATDRGTLQALGLAAAATMLATCLKLGCFQPVSGLMARSNLSGLRIELDVAAEQTAFVV